MDIKDVAREKVLVDMISERDQMILNLFNEIQRLQTEVDKLKKIQNNVDGYSKEV